MTTAERLCVPRPRKYMHCMALPEFYFLQFADGGQYENNPQQALILFKEYFAGRLRNCIGKVIGKCIGNQRGYSGAVDAEDWNEIEIQCDVHYGAGSGINHPEALVVI